MHAIIKVFGSTHPLITKETYPTIKKRLFTSELFLEVTDSAGKMLMNKTAIELVGISEVEVKAVKKVVKKAK